jgi:type II secretory pathway component GspD/PulD (secretin)
MRSSARCLFALALGLCLLPFATVLGGQSDKLRGALEQPIVLDFIGQSLHAALEHVAERAGVPVSIDQVALAQLGIISDEETGRVQVKAKDEKVAVVLRRLLAGYRLTYVLLDDTLLITSEDGAVRRLLQQRVDVNLTDAPLAKAARDLGRRHSVNVVIDPRCSKQAQALVTLQLDGAAFETAVRLLAELADLKSVRLGNVLFITSEERASRIRREEQGAGEGVPMVPGGLGPPVAGPLGAVQLPALPKN